MEANEQDDDSGPWPPGDFMDEELAGDDGRQGATVAQTTKALTDQFAAVATISRPLSVHVVAFVR